MVTYYTVIQKPQVVFVDVYMSVHLHAAKVWKNDYNNNTISKSVFKALWQSLQVSVRL